MMLFAGVQGADECLNAFQPIGHIVLDTCIYMPIDV